MYNSNPIHKSKSCSLRSIFVSLLLLNLKFTVVVIGNEVESTPAMNDESFRNTIPTMEVAIHSQKVFRFAFNPNLFGWSSFGGTQQSVTRYHYTYRPSLKGLPDMPYWMRYKYSHRHKAGIAITTDFIHADFLLF